MEFKKYIPNIWEKDLAKHFFHEKKLASTDILHELLRYNEQPTTNHLDNSSPFKRFIENILSYDMCIVKTLRRVFNYFTRLKGRPVYDLRQLIRLHDTEFIEATYSAILQRWVDEDGFQNCWSLLRDNKTSKVQILVEIKKSEEARQQFVKVKGLFKYSLLTRFFGRPLIGNLCKSWFSFFQWLDTSIAHYDLALSMHNNNLRLVEELESLNKNMNQAFADFSARINIIHDNTVTKEIVRQSIATEQLPLSYALKKMGNTVDDICEKYEKLEKWPTKNSRLTSKRDDLSIKSNETGPAS